MDPTWLPRGGGRERDMDPTWLPRGGGRGEQRQLCNAEFCKILASYEPPFRKDILGRHLVQHLKAESSEKFLLGSRSEIAHRKWCPFCCLATTAIENSGRDKNLSMDTIIYVKRCTDTDTHLDLVAEGQQSILGLGQRIVLCDPIGQMSKRSGCRVSSKRIPFNAIKEWIKACEDNHRTNCGKLYNRPQLRRQKCPNIRLIDITQDSVVQLPWTRTARYLALSYACGQPMQQLLTASNILRLAEPGGLTRYLTLPKTFRDAIELTKLLDERYLWIDSLCLPGDTEEFTKGIGSMDFVYEYAHATIVAAYGYSVNSGLPGVQENRHLAVQHVETIKPGLELMFYSALHCRLDRSHWATRGWT